MDNDNKTTRNILIAVVAIIAVVLLLFALGIFDADSQGELEAPEVSVEGGAVPDVDVDAADVDVGTTTDTVEVPDVDIDTTNATVTTPTVDVDTANADEE